jgi:hypothetical protein
MKCSGSLNRHNFECTPSILGDLLKAAGFNIDRIFIIDAFENFLPVDSKTQLKFQIITIEEIMFL